jgi:hypothetical protein
MSNFLFNEGLTYPEPKDDPLYPYFKEEEQEISTEPPFSLHSDSPSYTNNYYPYPYYNQDEQGYPLSYSTDKLAPCPSVQDIKDFPEAPKLGTNSKKIKREVAKQRTQLKQIVKPSSKSENDEQTEALLAELNNPNLDEKSSKKLKQMIRNRISAQNSRDRKKAYVSNMEKNTNFLKMQNTQLIQEITILKEANKLLISEKEEMKKKLQNDNSFCPHCRHNGILSPSTNTHSSDEALPIPSEEIHFDDYITRGDGGSPLFNRFFSGRSFLSYTLTVATVLSLVLLVNVSAPNGQAELANMKTNKFWVQSPMQNITNMTDKKEIAPILTEQPALNINVMLDQALKSPFFQNIYDMRNYFNEKAMISFFNHLKLNEKLASCTENIESYTKLETAEPIEIESESYPIVEYGFLNQAKKSRSEMERKGLATLSEYNSPTTPRKNKFSTLFCPAGFEFFDTENDDLIKKPSILDSQKVLDTEYLQFYIPKRQVTGIYKNKTSNELIISPEVNTADENVMLEVWCKVFHVRELSATLNL